MATVASTDVPAPQDSPWLRRLDQWCERVGDSLNPILVKETRQALKSRQFVTTFSVLLFAALAWTIAGSLSLMPQIYTSPSAPRLLIGYYVVLAIPMLLVVPLAAYRSLEGEIDDGTLELLSITTLSPWHIVLGKLASAMLQMLLYFVALFPCVAYAYTLRGVDLPTTLLMVCCLLVAAVVLTIVALFFAPLARSRTGRIVTLLAVMVILLGAEVGVGGIVIGLIVGGNSVSSERLLFWCVASLAGAISIGHLLLVSAAAQLTPESENRSTHVRLSLMAVSSVGVGLIALAALTLRGDVGELLFYFAVGFAALWTAAGSMMAAESPVMTPRIRRELPSSYLARALLTWLTPGPVTGLVFATVNVVILTGALVAAFRYVYDQPGVFGGSATAARMSGLAIAYAGYLIGFMVAVRWVIGLIRLNSNPRVEVGMAALIAVSVLAALIPYSVALHFNDYRTFEYSAWQISNWAWTLMEIESGQPMTLPIAIIIGCVLVGFFVTLFLSPKLVFPRRIATPKRVRAELESLRKK